MRTAGVAFLWIGRDQMHSEEMEETARTSFLFRQERQAWTDRKM